MIVLVVNLSAKSGKEDFVLQQFRLLEAESRKEAGCLMYIVHRGLKEPNQFLIYEQYISEAALEAHRQSAHFQRYAPAIYESCGSQQRSLFQPISEAGGDLIAD